ncbi:hypothetical protein [Streptomyces sp. NPDC059092]|uniref:hypothetical protein n=1 Tax=Streptomyces sp. NPDC059092 TaxID=3346725 RepID=UPI0036A65286
MPRGAGGTPRTNRSASGKGGPADAITALLLSEGAPPTAVIDGLAVRPLNPDMTA